MVLFYYISMLAVSIILVGIYTFFWHKHFDGHFTVMTILVPIINLGFVLLAISKNVGEAVTAIKLTYIAGCFLLLDTLFIVYSLCNMPLNKWIRVALITISSIVYLSSLTINYSNIFYISVDFQIVNGVGVLYNKHYGVMHTVFYALVAAYYLAIIGVIIYSFFKKKQVPRKLLIMICVPITIAMIAFFGGRLITHNIELSPLTYNLGILCYMFIVNRAMLYDPSDSVIEALVQKGETGFISIDNKLRYLSSNETANKMFPELLNMMVDHSISEYPWSRDAILPWIEEFRKDEANNKFFYTRNKQTFLILINNLKSGKRDRGYQLFLTDDTKNQEYIKLIRNYNTTLEEEVEKKTKNIVELQERLVMGMATMVEGRDNSTGGHIKRTSDCIKILMDEIKINNPDISDEFYHNIIKAAPMHDLGKITIDDEILRKPGRFTPEEFNIMKTHAAEGARIVHEILEGTADNNFRILAENVAHYHHERWDGSGYPMGLKGTDIPLEARIMAIADVYDALVSKRAYKERMSFEEADSIIMKGMGTQFDPSLEKYYVASKSKLEAYYKSIDE